MQKYTIRKIRKGHSLRKIGVEEILKTKLLRKPLVEIFLRKIRKENPYGKILRQIPSWKFLNEHCFFKDSARKGRPEGPESPEAISLLCLIRQRKEN